MIEVIYEIVQQDGGRACHGGETCSESLPDDDAALRADGGERPVTRVVD